MEVEEPKIPSSICWRHCYPGFEKDVWSGWKFTGIPHCQRGIKALFWEGICHMKNLPLQTTVKPAQAEGSVLQTALDWKGILILSRFKVQQKQGQWYLEKSNQRAAAEPNWEELLGLLLKLKHRGVLKKPTWVNSISRKTWQLFKKRIWRTGSMWGYTWHIWIWQLP